MEPLNLRKFPTVFVISSALPFIIIEFQADPTKLFLAGCAGGMFACSIVLNHHVAIGTCSKSRGMHRDGLPSVLRIGQLEYSIPRRRDKELKCKFACLATAEKV